MAGLNDGIFIESAGEDFAITPQGSRNRGNGARLARAKRHYRKFSEPEHLDTGDDQYRGSRRSRSARAAGGRVEIPARPHRNIQADPPLGKTGTAVLIRLFDSLGAKLSC